MNTPDETVYLRHMLDAIGKIERYVARTTPEEFGQESLVQDGLIRQLQIIGEAARRLSPPLRSRHSDIPWQKIFGMRNKLVHDYFGVDLQAVWETATKDVPALKTSLERMLDELPSP